MSTSAASSAVKAAPTRSEDILSAKTDLCVSNAIVKAGVGFGAGVVASAILFRRRPWPVLMGLGFGLGQGWSDCDRVFNPAAVPGFVIAGDDKAKSSPYANFKPFGGNSASSAPSASAVASSAAGAASSAIDSVKSAANSAAASIPKPSSSPAVADVPTIDTPAAATELKAHASDIKDKVVEEATAIKDKVVGKTKELEGRAQQKKADLGDKKWV